MALGADGYGDLTVHAVASDGDVVEYSIPLRPSAYADVQIAKVLAVMNENLATIAILLDRLLIVEKARDM